MAAAKKKTTTIKLEIDNLKFFESTPLLTKIETQFGRFEIYYTGPKEFQSKYISNEKNTKPEMLGQSGTLEGAEGSCNRRFALIIEQKLRSELLKLTKE